MFLNPNAMAAHAAQQQPPPAEQPQQQDTPGPVKLFVGQVPGVCTEDMLRPLFAGFGKVLEVVIMRDKTTNRSKGSAWVVYDERSSAETAIQLLHDQHIIPPQTNPLQIKFAKTPPLMKQQNTNSPFFQQQQVVIKQLNHLNKFGGHSHPSRGGRKLFVGQIPRSCTSEQLAQVMGQFGTVEEACVLKDKQTGLGKGCAFVVFGNREEADAAIRGLDGVHVMAPMGNPMQVSFAEGELEEREPKLFVGMVPYISTEDDIRAVFQHYGEISEVALLRGPGGQSRGCAFVKYLAMESAQAAVSNLHGNFKMEGGTSALTVKFADSEKEKKKRQKLKQTLSQLSMLGAHSEHSPQSTAPPSTSSSPGPSSSSNSSQNSPLPPSKMQPQMPPGMPQMPMMPFGPMGMFPNMGMMPGMFPGMMPNMFPGMMPPGSSQGHLPPSTSQPLQPEPHTNSKGAKRGPSASKKPAGPPGSNIFIMHLPVEWTDQELSGAFSTFGQILSAKVFRDRLTGASRGFGCVSFTAPAAAQGAMAMNGFIVPGHSVALKVQMKHNDRQGMSLGDDESAQL